MIDCENCDIVKVLLLRINELENKLKEYEEKIKYYENIKIERSLSKSNTS